MVAGERKEREQKNAVFGKTNEKREDQSKGTNEREAH